MTAIAAGSSPVKRCRSESLVGLCQSKSPRASACQTGGKGKADVAYSIKTDFRGRDTGILGVSATADRFSQPSTTIFFPFDTTGNMFLYSVVVNRGGILVRSDVEATLGIYLVVDSFSGAIIWTWKTSMTLGTRFG